MSDKEFIETYPMSIKAWEAQREHPEVMITGDEKTYFDFEVSAYAYFFHNQMCEELYSKIKELEKKLALAEGEWKTYAKSCESLSKKLAEANEMLTLSGIDELQNKLKVAVEYIKDLDCECMPSQCVCDKCEVLKKIIEGA